MSHQTSDAIEATDTLSVEDNQAELTTATAGSGDCSCSEGAAMDPVSAEAADEQTIPAEPEYVYAIGTIEPRFPSVSVEKEYAQAAAGMETEGLTDRQALYEVLRQNRYLAREMCWVLRIEGLESYILLIRDHMDLDQLVAALQPADIATDRDVVVGARGPMAGPNMCHGLVAPTLIMDKIYSFDIPGFIAAIPKPEGVEENAFRATAEELFHRIMQMADNVGASAEHRTVNYLAVRYPPIYTLATEMFARDAFLSGVDVRPDQLSGVRRIVKAVFGFTHRKTDVTEKFFLRVDVTEKWPFLVSKLQPFYDQ